MARRKKRDILFAYKGEKFAARRADRAGAVGDRGPPVPVIVAVRKRKDFGPPKVSAEEVIKANRALRDLETTLRATEKDVHVRGHTRQARFASMREERALHTVREFIKDSKFVKPGARGTLYTKIGSIEAFKPQTGRSLVIEPARPVERRTAIIAMPGERLPEEQLDRLRKRRKDG